ncbi:DUF1793-domain-containing protein [Microstroma glucosiphilum]|uniref:DUF1793-domain-containing protein n=1 Tax=Pseudomicrostroma glucosiphilum TaxID=1684307 RepID=A0A316UCF1_9BASI|nr:DUF1793-domain-containing protein [Pseudomicrostroma glucosiphilum]PWN22859.1 DUF1793-domain-containing protein [Pseudomicrostroma glucosiphilum]
MVFKQLADLTRPESEKRYPNQPFGSVEVSSEDLGYQVQGVDWKITKVQNAGGDPADVVGEAESKASAPDVHAVPGLAPIFKNGKTVAEADVSGDLTALREQVLLQSKIASASHGSKRKESGSTFSPMKPPSYPLAVKSPYLNDWAPAGRNPAATPPNRVGNDGYLAGKASAFWTSQYGADGDYRLGWNGFIRVDNVTYQWMGDAFGTTVRDGEDAEQLSVEYTSTKTIYKFKAGGVHFNATFMTPIWPHDFVRQSIPMSYLHFAYDSSTAKGKSVQAYVDIDERWVTAHVQEFDRYPYYQEFKDLKGIQRWYIQRRNPEVYKEWRQRAEWGSVTWAARDRPALLARNNNNINVQNEFITTGVISPHRDYVGGPQNAFAYSVDFDAKHGGNDVIFAIGHLRTPYVNYVKAVPGSKGKKSYQQDRYGLWAANFSSFDEVVTFFLDDFENALEHCTKLDKKIASESKAVVGGGKAGDEYAAITSLSVRQAMAGIEFTVSKNKHGEYDTSDLLIFLKEISSNGDMSTVDVFFPQFPILTYLNPELLKLVMLPIFEYTESGLYPNKWCVHDLGTYPNAWGYNDGDDEPMQVEESGNMVIMALHYAQLVEKSKAVSFLKKHYRIMAQWTDFLIQDSLIPASQLSTDDFAGVLANQTNLAIKGIAGIAAMGEIAHMVGRTTNATYYRDVAEKYVDKWFKLALSKDGSHMKLAYQDDKSWGTLYNLFADKLLDLRLVPKKVYDVQDKWYPTVEQEWGIPLDSRHNWTKSDWQMFSSATSASNSTRDLFISGLYSFYANGLTDGPMTDLYETTTGDFPKQPFDPLIYFEARPVVGGHFMHLAMQAADDARAKSGSEGPKAGAGRGVAQIKQEPFAKAEDEGEGEGSQGLPSPMPASRGRQRPFAVGRGK